MRTKFKLQTYVDNNNYIIYKFPFNQHRTLLKIVGVYLHSK